MSEKTSESRRRDIEWMFFVYIAGALPVLWEKYYMVCFQYFMAGSEHSSIYIALVWYPFSWWALSSLDCSKCHIRDVIRESNVKILLWTNISRHFNGYSPVTVFDEYKQNYIRFSCSRDFWRIVHRFTHIVPSFLATWCPKYCDRQKQCTNIQ